MTTKPEHFATGLTVPFVVLCASLFASCSFTPGATPILCTDFEAIPFTPLTSQTLLVKFNLPGTIIVFHGSGGAKLDSGQSAQAIKVEQGVPIPSWANRATVFMNGWRLSYLGDDQHVLGLGSAIARIQTEVDPLRGDTRLTWVALGLLRDDDGDEGYDWNYNFTVIAWNDGSINAVVDHGTVDANGRNCTPTKGLSDNFFVTGNFGTTTALSSTFSFMQNNGFAGSKTVAVLPRGFGFGWAPYWSVFGDDHHVLQLSYNLDHSEVFVDSNKQYSKENAPSLPGTTLVGSGFVSWNSYAMFKDNDTRRDYVFAEVVSGLGGNDVQVVQPPFSILPSDSASFLDSCTTLDSPPVRTEDFIIENIPFEFAIPMLTGWDLEYLCSDQHVKEVGIWIDDWTYVPPAGGAGGTLTYRLKSVLRDNDNNPDYAHFHKVTLLGFRPVSVVPGGPAGGR